VHLRRCLTVVDSHTAGEPTRIIIGGMPLFQGETLQDKNDIFRSRFDELRGMLTGEPRGHAAMHAVLPLPACDPDADLSLLILSAMGSQPMCGHALIGAVTVLLEVGIVEPVEPITQLMVETLAGLIHVEARVTRDRVTSVTFANAPSWVLERDISLDVPGVGLLSLDIVYGGLWYAVLDAAQLGLEITPPNVPRLVALSQQIRSFLDRRLPEIASHPLAPTRVPSLLYVSPAHETASHGRNLATSSELGFDRSPCGTGSSARMALLYARGELPLGQPFIHESVVGTRFEGRLIEEVATDAGTAVVPAITGSAFITGFSNLVIDPGDPLGAGFFIPAAGDSEPSEPLLSSDDRPVRASY
jgi:proline racemase